jgi:hypothetical protein
LGFGFIFRLKVLLTFESFSIGNLVTFLRISAMKVNLLGMYFTAFVHHSITITVLGGGK